MELGNELQLLMASISMLQRTKTLWLLLIYLLFISFSMEFSCWELVLCKLLTLLHWSRITAITNSSLHITRFIYRTLEANWQLMLRLPLRTIAILPAVEQGVTSPVEQHPWVHPACGKPFFCE